MHRRLWSFVIRHLSFTTGRSAWIVGGLLAFALLSTLAAGVVVRSLLVDLPSPDRLYERATAPSTRIYDRNGRLLYEILDPHSGAHAPVPLAEVPPACIEATVATEDASFYNNPGVDLWAIARALWINLRGGEILSGGSTITQQLARNLLLSPQERTEISLERKLRESILAWRLARTYTKDEILTLYLNETYYGNLAYGIEAAARTHFAKSAAELKARQSVVLSLMVKHGYISPQKADLAVNEKLYFASVLFPIKAPHFVMVVRSQLEREFGPESIYTQGLEVHTTLDLDAQNAADRLVRHRLAQLASSQDADQPSHNVRNAAVVAIDPHTGEVLAMVGSPDYFDPRIDGAVNAAVTIRQPGSSIKPITYAAAFDPALPNPLTAATMMVDVRTAFVTREGDPYVPRNYDRQWRGPVLLREALASSYNLIAVQVLDYVTIERMTALARSTGITTFDDADRWGLALTLGGGEVRLLELTAAYGAFANGGHRVEPVTITRVEDSRGQILKAWNATIGPRVMDERVAYLITDILSDNFARAPTFGEGSALRLSRPAAAKTGTTSDWRDNWTVGYTPDLIVGVWTGNADNEPMQHVSGVVGAAPIWHDVMETLLKGRPVRQFVEPPGMVQVTVCADSGLPPAQGEGVETEAFGTGNGDQRSGIGDWESGHPARCPRTITELFIEGTQPTRTDDWHWWFVLDTRNGLLASPDCPPEFTARERYTLYPAEASEWVRWQGIPQPPDIVSPLCVNLEAGVTGRETRGEPLPDPSSLASGSWPLVLISPDQGSHYQLSPEIPLSAQQIVVSAQAADSVALRQVTLLVDGRPLATLTRPPYQALWPMETGPHQFTATGIDVEGNHVQGNRVTIEVTD
jgi:membrane peptidoglycan carboxypeptidase